MEIKAKLKNLRIAPRKVRMVADTIRGKNVSDAVDILSFVINRPAEPILKLLNSAVSNAKDLYELEESNLIIAEIMVNEGVMLKRWMPRARGSASQIQKKTSHIEIILKEIEGTKIKKKKIDKKINKDSIKQSALITDQGKEEIPEKKKMNLSQHREDNKGKPRTDKVASKIFRRKSI